MNDVRQPDLAAYDIELTQTGTGKPFANVRDLPGCVAGADTAKDLEVAVAQAIVVYHDDHPDALAHWLWQVPLSWPRSSDNGPAHLASGDTVMATGTVIDVDRISGYGTIRPDGRRQHVVFVAASDEPPWWPGDRVSYTAETTTQGGFASELTRLDQGL